MYPQAQVPSFHEPPIHQIFFAPAWDSDMTQFVHCNSDPCHCVMYDEHLHGSSDTLLSEASPNIARRSLYRTYVMAVHGPQGQGNCIEILSCILVLIPEMHPNPHGEYMGHKPSALEE